MVSETLTHGSCGPETVVSTPHPFHDWVHKNHSPDHLFKRTWAQIVNCVQAHHACVHTHHMNQTLGSTVPGSWPRGPECKNTFNLPAEAPGTPAAWWCIDEQVLRGQVTEVRCNTPYNASNTTWRPRGMPDTRWTLGEKKHIWHLVRADKRVFIASLAPHATGSTSIPLLMVRCSWLKFATKPLDGTKAYTGELLISLEVNRGGRRNENCVAEMFNKLFLKKVSLCLY